PNRLGVGSCSICRNGTLISGREPCSKIFCDLGNGATAAGSTWADSGKKRGRAFMRAPKEEWRRRAGSTGPMVVADAPCFGIIRTGTNGLISPRHANVCARRGPLRSTVSIVATTSRCMAMCDLRLYDATDCRYFDATKGPLGQRTRWVVHA